MSEKESLVAIAQNDFYPSAVMAASVNEKQLGNLREYHIPSSVNIPLAGVKNTKVPLMVYRECVGDAVFPIHPDKIVAYSDDFSVAHDGFSFYGFIRGFLDFLDGSSSNHEPSKVVSSFTWRAPDKLTMEINVEGPKNARVCYNSSLGEILRVGCSPSDLEESFFDYILFDETGLYIKPTEKRRNLAFSKLEEFVADSAVKDVRGNLIRPGLNDNSYRYAARATRNLFRRAGEDFDEDKLLAVYDGAWNAELEKALPRVLGEIRMEFSKVLGGKKRYLGERDFNSMKVSQIYNAIVSGGIELDEGAKRDFSEIVVLDAMCKSRLEHERISEAQSYVGRLRLDIERKKKEFADKLSKLPRLRGRAAEVEDKIARERDSRLEILGIEDVVGFSNGVEPVGIEPLHKRELDDYDGVSF